MATTLRDYCQSINMTSIIPVWKKCKDSDRYYFTVFTKDTAVHILSSTNYSSKLSDELRVDKELLIYVQPDINQPFAYVAGVKEDFATFFG